MDLVHLEPVSYVMRLYRPGESFAQGDDFIASATVMIAGDLAFVAGLQGTGFTRQHYKEVKSQLRGIGFVWMRTKRRGHYKMTKL